MTDTPSNNPSTETKPPETTAPKQPATGDVKDAAYWEAEAERWKGFSRKNEDEKKAALAKLAEKDAANMTEAEKAIANAKAAARRETLAEVGVDLAKAALSAAAATAKVEVPEALAKFMKFEELVGEDGKPNNDAISALVASFKPAAPENPFAQDLGIGPQGDGTPALRDMSPREIAKRARTISPY